MIRVILKVPLGEAEVGVKGIQYAINIWINNKYNKLLWEM